MLKKNLIRFSFRWNSQITSILTLFLKADLEKNGFDNAIFQPDDAAQL